MKLFHCFLITLGFALALSACAPAQTAISAIPTIVPTSTTTPEWFDMQMTDVSTGQTFTIKDFAGKVVLVETMAIWCPNCEVQQNETKKLHELLGTSSDLVSISLDVDLHEDEPALKKYADNLGYDWHFAVAPLEVQRAIGTLYSPQYLNPPINPMLFIDRNGVVHSLPYGPKNAASLQKVLKPYLTP